MQRRRAVDTYLATLPKAERDRRAQRLLETTDLSVEQVAAELASGQLLSCASTLAASCAPVQ